MKATNLLCLFSLCLVLYTLNSCKGKTENTETVQEGSEIVPQKEIVLPDWIGGKVWKIFDEKGELITTEIFTKDNRIRFWMYGFPKAEDCPFYTNEITNDVYELKFYYNNIEMKVYINTQNNTFYTSTGTTFIDGSNPHSNDHWIIGDWVPDEEFYAEGEIVTFGQNGTFSFGDDCRTEGTYNIKDNAVYLKGKTRCYDSDSDFEEDYNITIAVIQGDRLKGYKKTISNEAITSSSIPSLSNSSEKINYLLQNTFRCEIKNILYVYSFVPSSYTDQIKLDMIAYFRGGQSKGKYEFAYDSTKDIFRKVAGTELNVNIKVESDGQVIVIFSDGKMAYLTKD